MLSGFPFRKSFLAICTTLALLPVAQADDNAAAGENLVKGVCIACHGSGMNGAPKLQNKIAWGPRIAQGKDKVYEHALKGLRGMPPRGGTTGVPDDVIKAGVDYMVHLAGGWPAK